MATNVAYKGERNCEASYKTGKPCRNFAYHRIVPTHKYVCGLHAQGKRVTDLMKNPNKELLLKEAQDRRNMLVEQEQKANKEAGLRGKIIVTKMQMMKAPVYVDGYQCIFPNYKHLDRSDGLGLPALSPKSLGPVDHHMPPLPMAKTIENFHQFAKVFPSEVDEHLNPRLTVLAERVAGYLDPEPHRHKPAAILMTGSGNKNIPLYSIYYDETGKEHRFEYIDCRWFYCYWYERLVAMTIAYMHLHTVLKDGRNINICGFDGYPVTQTLQGHYEDPSRPFGHELVLYSMLALADPAEYPWNVYYEKNVAKYESFKKMFEKK